MINSSVTLRATKEEVLDLCKRYGKQGNITLINPSEIFEAHDNEMRYFHVSVTYDRARGDFSEMILTADELVRKLKLGRENMTKDRLFELLGMVIDGLIQDSPTEAAEYLRDICDITEQEIGLFVNRKGNQVFFDAWNNTNGTMRA